MSALLDLELVDNAVQLATLAPSVHNTQPWRFVRRGAVLELWADRNRQLRVLDPSGRLLVQSCGAALHHLRVALRAAGMQEAVSLLPDRTQPDLLASVTVIGGPAAGPDEVADAVAELQRTTVRGRFLEGPLPAGLMEQLRRDVEDQGAVLRPVRGDELVDVQVLVARAEHFLESDQSYLDELACWVHPEAAADGIPLAAIDLSTDRGELVAGRAFVPPPRPKTASEPPVAEHPTLVVLVTPDDTPLDWLLAGQALSRLLLTCTEQHVAAQPIGQVTDLPSTRTALAGVLGLQGKPQMLLRLGRAAAPHQTGRRSLADVLEVRDE